MPFKFWGGEEAETEFRADIMSVHKNAGYTGCYTAAQTKDKWKELRAWSRGSPTAVELLQFIDQASVEIHVVGMSGGFQCFGSTQGLAGDKGVIFVDLDAKLNILANTTHNLHLPLDTMAKIWAGSVGGQTTTELDNRITLLHEIGHGKQWINRPGWFDKDYRTATKVSSREGAPSMKDITAQEIRAKAKEMHLKTAIKNYKTGDAADLSFLPPDQREESDTKPRGQTLEAPVGWGVPIEHDNMRRHEWPICREKGLPLRSNYGDISDGGSVKNRQLTSLIKRWTDEELDAKAAKNAAFAVKSETVCPGCRIDFKSGFKLRMHYMDRNKGPNCEQV